VLILVGALALGISTLELCLHRSAPDDVARMTWGQAHTFGAILLVALEGALDWGWLGHRLPRLLAAAIWIVGGLCLLDATVLVFPAVLWLPGPHHFSFEVITTAAAAALVGVPLLLQAAGRRCWRALDNPFTRWLGTRSYSIYLYHLVVFAQFAAWVGGPLGYRRALLFDVLAGLPVIFLVSELSYRLVEQPALSLKGRVRRASADATPPPVAPAR